MKISNRRESFALFIGDLFFFVVALLLTLIVRNGKIPDQELFLAHLEPFSLIFAASILVYYIAGLYEKHTALLKSRLPSIIFRAQFFNSIIAVLFFYFIPYYGITPKTTLFIYLVISLLLIFLWRLWISTLFTSRRIENALLIGSGKEMEEVLHEVNKNTHYGLYFVKVIDVEKMHTIDFEKDILNVCNEQNVSVVIIDLDHDKVQPILSNMYSLIFSHIRFVSMYKMYEEVFDRIPFSVLHYDWFLENISASPKVTYDLFKRTVDIVASFLGGIISLIVYPFVYLAIKLDDGGPVFITQERIGKGGKKVNIVKFRSMRTSDRGVWVKEKDDRITRVGKFLRKSRIDELPQLWNVLLGNISLIGPRPDIYDLGIELATQIPYYNVRNTLKPGLSGWAQVSQELPPQSLEETKIRLAYDIYYVKNRSIMLDIKIIFKTIRTLLSRTGK